MADSLISDRELKLLCRAVGDLTRLRMVRHLAIESEVNVTDLAAVLVLSQPLASWHVRILKRSGILTTRKEGRQVYCSLDRRRLAQFQQAIGELSEARAGKDEVWEKSALPSSA